MTKAKPVILIRCMDKRHTIKAVTAFNKLFADKYEFYQISPPGGAGVLADLNAGEADTLLNWMSVAVNELHCEEIFLAIHGVSDADMNGCGGYLRQGFGNNFKNPEVNRAFAKEQLTKAAATVRTRFPDTPVSSFYITFDTEGNNILEEISVS